MEKINEVKNLLQSAVIELYHAEHYCKEYLKKAHRLGLQGEKRRLRYDSVKYHNLINYFTCDFLDLYGLDLIIQYSEVSVPPVTGIPDFFKKVLENYEDQYDKFHEIANKLVLLNAQNYAGNLYDICDCLTGYIKYYRRTVLEGETTGWKPEYIFLHQTTGENIHDEYEKKEHEIGYKN